MVLNRRGFLGLGALGLAAAAGGLWLAPRRARAASAPLDPILVVIFLRGGADGLHLVAPIGDPSYASLRGSLALSKTIPFVDGFGLHPALEALGPLQESGQLAAVHAVGSDDRSRSHFEAQDEMELADPERRGGGTGWLARAFAQELEPEPFASLALANTLPLALAGSDAFAIGDPARFGLDEIPDATQREILARYEAAGDDAVALAGRRAFAALREYSERTRGASLVERGTATGTRLSTDAARPQTLERAPRRVSGPDELRTGARGRGRPRRADPPLSERIRQIVALERSGIALRAIALDCQGFDTHQRQGTDAGAMVRPLRELAAGLSALADGFRGRRDWIAVAMTEFGRTVRPNGSQGTDHGHASAFLVAGPRVRPGVHGRWPGLEESALHEGRDLAVATDYRQVLHEVLVAHFGGPPPPGTFPGLAPSPIGVVEV